MNVMMTLVISALCWAKNTFNGSKNKNDSEEQTYLGVKFVKRTRCFNSPLLTKPRNISLV